MSEPESAGLDIVEPVHEELNWKRVLLTCAAVLGGALGLFVLLVALRPSPPKRVIEPARVGVQVYPVQPRELKPTVTGLGRSRPRRVVRLSALVGGQVLAIHDDLKDGLHMQQGDLALRIDPADYQLQVERGTAALEAARAEEARLRAQVAHLTSRVAVSRRELALEQDEERRIERLRRDGVGTDRDLEVARLASLRAEDTLISLQTTQSLLGPQIDTAAAKVREAEAGLQAARLDLARTEVRLPFAGQIARVNVEAGERVQAGAALFELWETDVVEVPVVLSLEDAALLTPDLRRVLLGESDEAPRAEVRFEGHGTTESWEGVLRRLEPVDADTQTVRAVVEVRNDRRGLLPLPPHVFCRVNLSAHPVPTTSAIPLEALQERDRVFTVRDGKLDVLNVQVGRRLGRWVEVAGLEAGAQVIVSPLEKPIEGTPLEVLGEDAK